MEVELRDISEIKPYGGNPRKNDGAIEAVAKSIQELGWRQTSCPKCQSARLKKYRSISDQGDGSSMSWVRCLGERCGNKFKVLLE